MKWGRHMHKYPCPETDHIDSVLNELEKCTMQPTPDELAKAKRWGRELCELSIGFNDWKVTSRSAILTDQIAMLCEILVARYLGREYRFSAGTYRKADIGKGIEVRSTTYPQGHCKVRPDDVDTRFVVLAIAPKLDSPVYLACWIRAADGKQFPLKDPQNREMPFHFVPQSALRPMQELKSIIQ